ncbi:MAG: 50S ribosomal protein L17 [Candidatus Eisenbacteria bacterium]|jgi:large subunit ribosomal protein L17
MRHRRVGRKLGRKKPHREMMLRNMVTSLFKVESIRTTEARAKEARKLAERIITWAKKGDLHSRRMAFRYVRDDGALKHLFETIGPRFKARAGGYTRIMKLARRHGDAAPVVILELTEKSEKVEEAKAARKAKKQADKEAKSKEREKGETNLPEARG